MKRTLQLALLCAGALAYVAPVAAQTVYRCGSAYSQQPCAGGSALDVTDERSAAQRMQTANAAQRDARAAEAMEKARVREEARPAQAVLPPPTLAGVDGTGRYKPVANVTHKPELFKAGVPRKPEDKPAKKKHKSSRKRAA